MKRKKTKPLATTNRLGIIYVRVSSLAGRTENAGPGERDLLSPEIQKRLGEEYFAAQGVPVDEEASEFVRDVDESAYDRPWEDRPGATRLHALLQSGRYTDICFYRASRFGRNLRESLNMVHAYEHAAPAFSVRIHFPEDHIDTGRPDGRDKLNMLLLFAEWASNEKRGWARDAAVRRALKGRVAGAVPFWLQKEEDNRFTEVPEAVALVERVLTLRLGGLSYVRVARALNQAGEKTPRGLPWTRPSVMHLTGEVTLDALRGTAWLNHSLPEGDPRRVMIPNVYPAVVSEGMVAAVRALQGAGKFGEAPSASRRVFSTTFTLTGRLRCAGCGRPMGTSVHRGLRAYWCEHATAEPERHRKAEGAAEGGTTDTFIVAGPVEEAVLRVLGFATKLKPVTEGLRRRREKGRGKERIEEERRRLLELHLRNPAVLTEADLVDTLRRLGVELAGMEALERAEAAPALRQWLQAAQEAKPVQGRTVEETRALVLATCERIICPVYIPEETHRENSREPDKAPNARRCVRVVLTNPVLFPLEDEWAREVVNHTVTTFVAPLYRSTWKQQRRLYPEIDGPEDTGPLRTALEG